jgi:NAD(P)-dependent dehydrogenase (short-subunit alcohol dehydrogenase family)
MDRYVSAHISPNGPGDARPTAEQIINDQELIGKLTDKVILITGGTAGLGTESARVLQKTGAKVFITARTSDKGEKAIREIMDVASDFQPVEYVVMDLSSLESVREGAKDFLSRTNKLNILMNNAGVMACPEGKTADGFETQFGTNHIAHFLLFQLMLQTLLSSSTPEFKSRVISLSSSGHRAGDIHPDNYILEGEYEPWKAYGQSKTANALFANEIERRYGPKGLHAWSVHPGVIMDTELSRHQLEASSEQMESMLADERFKAIMKNTGQGASTQVWAAVAKELEGKGGMFLNDAQVASEADADAPLFLSGWGPHIWNKENAARLWEDSLKMVGM